MSLDEFQDADMEVYTAEDSTPVQNVFLNDLLLDKILGFVMTKDDTDDDDYEHMQTTLACKFVNRLWRERVCAAIKKSPPEWYNVKLRVAENPDRTEEFINTFTDPAASGMLPFSLHCHFHEDKTEKVQSTMWDCLTKCGTGLLEILMEIDEKTWPLDSESILIPPVTVSLNLPKLESVDILVCYEFLTTPKNVQDRAKLLFQSILAGSKCLKEIELTVNEPNHPELISPAIFENLKLPHTLVRVHLQFKMRAGLLSQVLLESPLPNLIDLTVISWSSNSSMFNELELVLHKFRKQLKRLVVEIWEERKSLRNRSEVPVVVLPVMKCLKEFKWTAKMMFEWSVPALVSIENHLPALTKISLHDQTYVSLQKWLDSAKFWLVEEAKFDFAPEASDLCDDDDDYELLQLMHRIKQSFPRIVKLSFHATFTEQFSYVHFIFQEMRQLKQLKIKVYDYDCEEDMSLDEFDSLFLGLGTDEASARALSARREDWQELTRINMPGLRKLVIKVVNDDDVPQYSSLGWKCCNFVEEQSDDKN